ncbi:MAG: PilZ domain-containing protein [Candidatus Thiodiazotropha sp. (ex Dulcina madagascariensis)]|nr:PilZ domain-containing protein [Candidatus Thiodiazotropha sp. (ex Dulcina madagascariensis)]MCU7925262.1 PilZ domain-containing protein [Candidatus Thiodiazotropha sp. (ex Dulcina madagascariensis)]
MEHRRDHRKFVSVEIVINDRNVGKLKGKIRNISLSGILVDIGDSSQQLSTIVDVSFPVCACGGTNQCQAKALVVHQQSGCLGLMFSELDAGVRQMLRKMLYGYATVAERAYLYQGFKDTSRRAIRSEANTGY